ncbi:MAG: pirin family protein [Anaerolineae bacterium]|nr:pirin family protein [Anaerolineae bacterium]
MTTKPRTIQRLVEPQLTSDGAGVRLRRSIASARLDYLDPFLLLDEFRSDDPDDYIAGFPMHPHRGIETVTYMIAGEVNHRDTLGNSGTIGPGDVQWMTAGRAIMHEEMPAQRDGLLHGYQLWVNLPARDKMMPPRYQDIIAARIPEITRHNVTIRVIAGTVDGVQGPVTDIVADPTYLDVSMPANSRFAQPIPRGHTAFAYVFQGQGLFGIVGAKDGTPIVSPTLAILSDGDRIEVRTADHPARFLLVSGKPIGEPIARYGPFVMNTREEIQQTLQELRDGTFIPKPA